MLATTALPGLEQLRGVIESLRSQVLADLPDAHLEEDLTELHGAIEALEVERLRRLAHAERRKIHERDGHLSITAWLVGRYQLDWGKAKELISSARALEQMPQTHKALEASEISSSALKLLVRAREVDPSAFARSEATLVDAARIHPIADLHRVLSHWSLLAEQERYPDAQDRQRARRGLHASATLYGMTRADGDLTPEVGSCFLTALGAVMDAEAHRGGEEERTAAQRRHDALGVICRAFLDSKDRPRVAGELPHLSVVVPLETLSSGTGEAQLEHVGPIGAELARRLACDASVQRVVLDPRGHVLDVGRATPVVPKGIRRAVIARDKTCAFPACGTSASWSDAHHVRHWADGGDTALGNLALLCRGHHRLIHEGGFSMQMVDGRPVFFRADGSVLQDRAPPG
jgi:hypothetical protein